MDIVPPGQRQATGPGSNAPVLTADPDREYCLGRLNHPAARYVFSGRWVSPLAPCRALSLHPASTDIGRFRAARGGWHATATHRYPGQGRHLPVHRPVRPERRPVRNPAADRIDLTKAIWSPNSVNKTLQIQGFDANFGAT
jgi:hypothetical protein